MLIVYSLFIKILLHMYYLVTYNNLFQFYLTQPLQLMMMKIFNPSKEWSIFKTKDESDFYLKKKEI